MTTLKRTRTEIAASTELYESKAPKTAGAATRAATPASQIIALLRFNLLGKRGILFAV